jgi:hypothetical protein
MLFFVGCCFVLLLSHAVDEFDRAVAEGEKLLEQYEGYYKEMAHPTEKKKYLEFYIKICQGIGELFRNSEHFETALKYMER